MTSARVLVVADEYYASLAAVRALRAGGYEPWVAAATAGCLAASSRAVAGHVSVPRPSAGEEDFVAAVADAVARWGIDVVLPGTEPSLLALAGRPLGRSVIVGAPPRHVVVRATAKETLAETGLRTPGGTRFSAPTAAAPAVDLPAVVKPARSTVEGDGATVDLPPAVRVEDERELERVVAALPPGEYLAQPYVAGGLGAIAGVAWHGELVCVGQQAAERIQPPLAGASAYARSVPVDPVLFAAAERFVAAVGWSGLWEIQFLGGPDPVAIDFNPRFYGSLALAVASGLNLPSIWVDLLLGREPRVSTYRPGRGYRAEARDAKLLFQALRGRRLAEAAAIAVPRRRTTHAVFSWRDPAPALHLIRRAVRRR